jgi:Ca2+-binding RTX toxin-like protein
MAGYVSRDYHVGWQGGIGDRLTLVILGRPSRHRVNWGDGPTKGYQDRYDQNEDGVPDTAYARHGYARDGVYDIAVREAGAGVIPPVRLHAHVHVRDGDGHEAVGGDMDEMFLMGGGDDVVRPGAGSDFVSAGDGNDRVYGGTGRVWVKAGNGDDLLYGGAGSDQLHGENGNDVIYGRGGYDLHYGDGGDDLLTADPGGSWLFGGAGRDRLVGGAGSDRAEGGAEADTLTGGVGGDLFQFDADGRERDVITDFGNDREGSRDVMRLEWAPHLRFIGTDAFSGAGREIRFAHRDGFTFVFGDVDGDMRADYSIKLNGVIELTAADFSLF